MCIKMKQANKNNDNNKTNYNRIVEELKKR